MLQYTHYTRKIGICTDRGLHMREFQIQITCVRDVLTFVNQATSRPFRVTVGNENHQVNGKSFMEMFCLNFSGPLTATMDCAQEEYEKFLADVSDLLVK